MTFVDYLQPEEVAATSSSSEMLDPGCLGPGRLDPGGLDPGRLGRFVPLPGRRRPHSNVIQPAANSREPLITLPGPRKGEKESE